MSTLTVTEAQESLAELCATVAETGEPIVIHREGQPDVMLVPSYGNTDKRMARLLANTAYVNELKEAVQRVHAGEEPLITTTIEELKSTFLSDADRP